MGDRENTNPNKQKPSENTTARLPPVLDPPAPDPEQPHGAEVHCSSESNPEPPEKWFRNPDWWMVALTGLILAATIGTAVIFYRQFKEMSNQTKILNDGATQATKDAVEATGRVKEQIEIARKQTKASQDSVAAIQRQMRIDQRPWLKLGATFKPFNANVGDTIKPTISIQNSGKTAAISILAEWVIDVVDEGSDLKFSFNKPRAFSSTGVLFPTDPAMVAEISWQGTDPKNRDATVVRTFTDAEIKRLADGKSFIIIYGRVRYTDSFDILHWTHYCSWTFSKPGSYHAKKCTAWNGVDKNY